MSFVEYSFRANLNLRSLALSKINEKIRAYLSHFILTINDLYYLNDEDSVNI